MTARDPSGDAPASSGSSKAAQRMLGAVRDAPALGRGPADDGGFSQHDYHHPAAGWGAAVSVAEVVARTHEPASVALAILVVQMTRSEGAHADSRGALTT